MKSIVFCLSFCLMTTLLSQKIVDSYHLTEGVSSVYKGLVKKGNNFRLEEVRFEVDSAPTHQNKLFKEGVKPAVGVGKYSYYLKADKEFLLLFHGLNNEKTIKGCLNQTVNKKVIKSNKKLLVPSTMINELNAFYDLEIIEEIFIADVKYLWIKVDDDESLDKIASNNSYPRLVFKGDLNGDKKDDLVLDGLFHKNVYGQYDYSSRALLLSNSDEYVVSISSTGPVREAKIYEEDLLKFRDDFSHLPKGLRLTLYVAVDADGTVLMKKIIKSNQDSVPGLSKAISEFRYKPASIRGKKIFSVAHISVLLTPQENRLITVPGMTDFANLDLRGEHYFFKDKLFSGKVYKHNKYGEEIFSMYRGKRKGSYVYLGIDGDTLISGAFLDGMRQGEWKEYYANGNLKKKEKYYRNSLISYQYWYHMNGKISVVRNYNYNKYEGTYWAFDEEGRMIFFKYYENNLEKNEAYIKNKTIDGSNKVKRIIEKRFNRSNYNQFSIKAYTNNYIKIDERYSNSIGELQVYEVNLKEGLSVNIYVNLSIEMSVEDQITAQIHDSYSVETIKSSDEVIDFLKLNFKKDSLIGYVDSLAIDSLMEYDDFNWIKELVWVHGKYHWEFKREYILNMNDRDNAKNCAVVIRLDAASLEVVYSRMNCINAFHEERFYELPLDEKWE